MWKYFKYTGIVLWLVLSVFSMVQADDGGDENDVGMTLDEMVDAMSAFTDGCDPPPEKEHVKQLLKSDENPAYETKCLRRCLMEQFDIIGEKETTMDEEKTVDIMSMAFTDENGALKQIVQTCNAQNGAIAERCENAHAHGMCTLKQLKEHGFKIPDIKE